MRIYPHTGKQLCPHQISRRKRRLRQCTTGSLAVRVPCHRFKKADLGSGDPRTNEAGRTRALVCDTPHRRKLTRSPGFCGSLSRWAGPSSGGLAGNTTLICLLPIAREQRITRNPITSRPVTRAPIHESSLVKLLKSVDDVGQPMETQGAPAEDAKQTRPKSFGPSCVLRKR